jgi:uncharacterized protein
MRLSRFNTYIADFPDAGDVLIYNHLTGGLVPVTAEGMALLRRIDDGETVSPDALAELAELCDPDYGVLVDSALVDERRFAERMDLLRKNREHLSVIVSTSLACNFSCSYCLQDGVMDGQTMSFDTTFQTGKWIATRMREIGADSVALSVLGGEPLLHPHIVESLARQVGKAARESGVDFSFNIVTNGFFLDRQMAERLRALGCTHAKVTLDGDETTHDLTRPLKNGKSSFQTIWNNIREAAPVLPIHINGNYTEKTLPGFRPLIEKLRAAGFDKSQVPAVFFHPALAQIAAPESGVCHPRMSDGDHGQYMGLIDATEEAGFATDDGIELGPCGFHNANHFAVDPKGHVYKCSGFLGMPEFAIGKVSSQELGPLYKRALSPAVLSECGACANRPSCAGGCVASAWIQTGVENIGTEVQCDKPYFQSIGVEAIKRRWRRERGTVAEIAA